MSRNIELVAVSALKPYARNARTHSKKQIEQIAASIKAFGFVNPILVDDDLTIIAGHGRLEAAKLLGINDIPILRVSHLDAAQRRAYIIADNRLAEQAGWDPEILALELKELIALDLDIEVIGFETAELDLLITAQEVADPAASDGADAAPPPPASAITQLGDIWEMGSHRLVCGDALDASVYADLLGEARADLIFTDPPYNVRINGHAGGKGKVTRHEFAMASGEMSRAQFEAFLNTSLGLASDHAKAGAIAFVCMDWRHIGELLAAAEPLFEDLKNICVWVKSNGGMGSLYRSQHELVCVFKKAGPPHLNNVQLGKFGRNRTNVWNYAGVNAFGAARDAELAMHPTVKPAALVEDAIKDVTKRGAIVLDPFGGSGTTLIASQKCGRSARLIELDPRYCDVIVRRFARPKRRVHRPPRAPHGLASAFRARRARRRPQERARPVDQLNQGRKRTNLQAGSAQMSAPSSAFPALEALWCVMVELAETANDKIVLHQRKPTDASARTIAQASADLAEISRAAVVLIRLVNTR